MKMHVSVALLALCAGAANADVVNLTQPMSAGVIGGTRFETSDFRTGGTGAIDSFVRIQAANQTVVQGYNTSGIRRFDELGGNFTRDLTFGEIPTRVIDGIEYKEFILDINQLANSPELSLDEVQIYTNNTAFTNNTPTNPSQLGSLVYDLDGINDSWIHMNYLLATGSGQGDMVMFVPVSYFGNATANTFVYLYSLFGQNLGNNDGFEEWAVREGGGAVVPLPPAAMAGGASLLGLALVRTIRRRNGR
jgi:hypothetical protein